LASRGTRTLSMRGEALRWCRTI